MKTSNPRKYGFNLFHNSTEDFTLWRLEGLCIEFGQDGKREFAEFTVEDTKEKIREFVLENYHVLECGVITDLVTERKIWLFYRKFEKLIWETINF